MFEPKATASHLELYTKSDMPRQSDDVRFALRGVVVRPVAATLYLRGKRWSVGWNGDFIEVLLRQRRRSYGIAGSVGNR